MKLFTKATIFVFTLIGSTLFGSMLFADNLKQADKAKHISVLIAFGLIWNLLITTLLRPLNIPFLPIGVANISGALLLIGPIWKYYLSSETDFVKRSFLGPLLALIITYGAIIGATLYFGIS